MKKYFNIKKPLQNLIKLFIYNIFFIDKIYFEIKYKKVIRNNIC